MIEHDLSEGCRGLPPLPARLEPWMQEVLADAEGCAAMLEEHGSPLNLHDFSALARNAAELEQAAERAGVRLRIFAARKANKTLGMMDAAHAAGHGVDVGSYRELAQALDRGIPAADIVVTAAVKPRPLLRLALDSGALLVLDNLDEASSLAAEVADRQEAGSHPIALRLAPTPDELIAPTRFGESASTWQDWAREPGALQGLRIEGVHFHLHGYDVEARARAVGESTVLIDALREAGHRPWFLDIGGGIPMSYLDDAERWDAFWVAHDGQGSAPGEEVTWRGEPLRQVYPYHQALTRGAWMEELLRRVARDLRARDLELRCEPGRSLLDGCGMTLARVVQRTATSDGIPLVGVEMNRTQCRSTSDDFLVDPVLVRTGGEPSRPMEGFLVGAYCIEAELILRRRLAFPGGVAAGDVLALPNTAGYLMHILESASHQLPLASNVVREGTGFRRDGIDALSPMRP